MAQPFTLWDLEAGNLVGAYDTQAAALAVVESALASQGPARVSTRALVYEDEGGELTTIGEGRELVCGIDGRPPDSDPRQTTPRPR